MIKWPRSVFLHFIFQDLPLRVHLVLSVALKYRIEVILPPSFYLTGFATARPFGSQRRARSPFDDFDSFLPQMPSMPSIFSGGGGGGGIGGGSSPFVDRFADRFGDRLGDNSMRMAFDRL